MSKCHYCGIPTELYIILDANPDDPRKQHICERCQAYKRIREPPYCGSCSYYQSKLPSKSEYPKQCNWDMMYDAPFGEPPSNCPLGFKSRSGLGKSPGRKIEELKAALQHISQRLNETDPGYADLGHFADLASRGLATAPEEPKVTPAPGMSLEETNAMLAALEDASREICTNTKQEPHWLRFGSIATMIDTLTEVGLAPTQVLQRIKLAKQDEYNGFVLYSAKLTEVEDLLSLADESTKTPEEKKNVC
jgi:hypothetical protein